MKSSKIFMKSKDLYKYIEDFINVNPKLRSDKLNPELQINVQCKWMNKQMN